MSFTDDLWKQIDPIYVDFSLPQKQINGLSVGQVVNATTDGYPGVTFPGHLTAISPKVDPATRNVVVQATFQNAKRQLLPGMFANAAVEVGDKQKYLTLPQTAHVLHNDQGEVCGDGSGQAPLITAFAQSCDTTFGKIGMQIGANSLNDMAQKFGMNDANLNIPLPVAKSNYVIPPSQALTAFSAIGQFSDTVTPLQEAMFAAAIANGGTLMKPDLVQQVTASDLSTVQGMSPSVLSHSISSSVSDSMKQMMLAVVQQPEGTAYAFRQDVTGVEIAGKTGTAETGAVSLNDAAFTCFAPFANPDIAVGVIIQGGGYGASAAAPIAVQVIKAYQQAVGNQ